ncbi:MAG: CapA family protein [Chloroflexi bacterium]|nr:CapA family protein [Chloroflexota bacterium]
MSSEIRLIAVGDIGPQRENPGEIFDLTRSILRTGDITFGQLEDNLSERGTLQLGTSSASRIHPRFAKDLANAGFTVLSNASNRTMNFGAEALLDTLENLKAAGITVIGVGKNLADARQPRILDIEGTKIGFLGYCSVIPRGSEAGEDKPGAVPLRAATMYEPIDWQAGTPPGVVTQIVRDDLDAMVNDIENLRPKVDILVVSMHWGIHFIPAVLAMYQFEAGHAAIDAGADVILGHHAHILKGIEVYRGKVIFFSLGNFNMDTQQKVMAESRIWRDLYHYEMDPAYPTFAYPIDSQKTIMVRCTIADKQIKKIAFLPLWINPKGQPEPLAQSDARSDNVYEYVKWLCRNQGLKTTLSRNGDEIAVSA